MTLDRRESFALAVRRVLTPLRSTTKYPLSLALRTTTTQTPITHKELTGRCQPVSEADWSRAGVLRL